MSIWQQRRHIVSAAISETDNDGREFCGRPDRHPYELFLQLEEMQRDLDAYLEQYNTERPHRGRGMEGRTPYQVFKAGLGGGEKGRQSQR